jgi:hypothetical protein
VNLSRENVLHPRSRLCGLTGTSVIILYCVTVAARSILFLSVVRSFWGGRCVELVI